MVANQSEENVDEFASPDKRAKDVACHSYHLDNLQVVVLRPPDDRLGL